MKIDEIPIKIMVQNFRQINLHYRPHQYTNISKPKAGLKTVRHIVI